MARLVNLKPRATDPLFFNADDVALIQETKDRKGAETVLIQGRDASQLVLGEKKDWGLDAAVCARQIQKFGKPFLSLPLIWQGDDPHWEYGRVFINPEAVNFVVTSAPYMPKGEVQECVAAIIGIDGHGRVETCDIPVAQMESFEVDVVFVNPAMMRIDPQMGTSRFVHPGHVLLNPEKLERIYPNGYDIDVDFRGAGRLDFNLGRNRNFQQEWLKVIKPCLTKKGAAVDDDKIITNAHRYEEHKRGQLRRAFAQALAQKAPQLVEVKGGKDVYYTALERLGQAYLSQRDGEEETSLILQYRPLPFTNNRYGEHGRVRFFTRARAEGELARLQTLTLK